VVYQSPNRGVLRHARYTQQDQPRARRVELVVMAPWWFPVVFIVVTLRTSSACRPRRTDLHLHNCGNTFYRSVRPRCDAYMHMHASCASGVPSILYRASLLRPVLRYALRVYAAE
jgi:hypothetical protein